MATTNDVMPLTKCECPLCRQLIEEAELERVGITKAEIETIKRHTSNGTFGMMLQLVDVVMGKLDPEEMNRDLQTKNAIAEILGALDAQELVAKRSDEEILKVVHEILLKLAGPGIEKVGEAITIKDFKAAIIDDEFSDEKADRHGADIVAIVKENKEAVGKIVISVKYDNQWKNDFIRQLRSNMDQEGTEFGLLATNSLPRDALGEKVMVHQSSTGAGLMLLVKQEYASVAYQGLRYAVIASEKAQRTINDAQQRIDAKSQVFKAMLEWVHGRQFEETMEYINICKKLSDDTEELANQVRDHTVRKVKAMLDLQQQLKHNFAYMSDAIGDLKRILKIDGEGGLMK